ncbi:MAG: hypothetical protein HYR80_02405, partial [Nitrospirae bacterium]|nr:hypothetical protein [Nitrospirota bacterium]
MKVSKTARQKLKNYTRYLGYTLGIYREAFAWINQVVYDQWASIEKCLSSKERVNLIERLIHSTSKNKAPFSQFDQRFYKFPSYFRRMVIMESIGHVSSHLTRFNQWKANPKGKEPAFQPNCQSFPVFYKKNMSEWMRNGKIRLKLYTGTDWIWFVLPFNPVNMERFPALERWVRKNPMLVQKGKKWLIHIPFEKEV